MKKIITFIIFILISTLSNSQDIEELSKEKEGLIEEKDALLIKKRTIEYQIDSITNNILIIEDKIAIQELKTNAIKTSLKRNSNLYELPSVKTKILEPINQKEQLYLIEYYEYGEYYKVIYNNKIGYIKESDIIHSKAIKALKKKPSTNPSTPSSQSKSSYNKGFNSSRSSVISTCGALTKSGGYCKRKVKGGGHCYQH
ncbi:MULTISPECIES: hypothetical protein [unclassified Cellulophaga]|uniref:hypothetical protein n=1 Tax=unclassified Cellulophaga TaxID=2634405 RepID=UPI0026E46372|nr:MULTISPECIES: hypothetical protein [unclassified Cellulophaga]MDO6491153.1 hypothetical protein [Cellulophaga sp. 2_MG-2023]MDO6495314.1 hypothetical protein [Cellulophaga sp. 3_MG-2023]